MSFSKRILGILMLITLVTYSCKRKKDIEIVELEPKPVDTVVKDTVVKVATRDELTKDSIFLYAKQVYYWYDALPADTVFKPRSFTQSANSLSNYESELFKITQYKINPQTTKPYEYVSATAGYPKYSYITDITQQNTISSTDAFKSSVDLNDIGSDFGLKINFYGSSNNYRIYVQAVYPNSPAESAGLKRGDYINVINGSSVGSNFDSQFDAVYAALFESSSVIISGKRRDNTNFLNIALVKKSYTSTPILKDTVFVSGAKKIGYMSYARFSNPSNSVSKFNEVFNKFASSGVTDLIIDLRYNGGGYVSSAEYLTNLIAPSSLNNTTMFTEYYNQLMQQNYQSRNTNPTAPLLAKQYILTSLNQKQDSNSDGKWDSYADIDFSAANQITKFAKKGSLGSINKIAFIVTGATASASELVINCLKPHLNVKVVGAKSYGKPVGFFPIRIDKYDVYYSMFETKNSLGSGGYFNGITPDIAAADIVFDETNYDMWSQNDPSFSAAFNFIVSATTSAVSSKKQAGALATIAKPLSSQGKSLEDVFFKGMVEDRIKIK